VKQFKHYIALFVLLLSLLFACPALDYHWIVAKCFPLRVGWAFAPDASDLLSVFLLSILSMLRYCTKFGKLIFTKVIKVPSRHG